MFGSGVQQAFARQVAQKTGLQAQNDRFVGSFQGLPAWTKVGPVADAAGAVMGRGGMLGGLGALIGGTAGGMAQMMTGGAFFMKHDYVIELTGSQLPGGSLRMPSGFLVDKTYQMRPAVGQRASSGVPWIDSKYEICSLHPQFMPFVCASPELQQALQHWPAPLNLSWQGPQVWLEILDSPTRINSWFNMAQQQNGDMILMGMTVVAAAARATFAR
ncbi:MAG: hypothetical protein HY744_12850 [Deltaproteobacteria bacterium]|nr:hypothetical protein [Deltaproteobacteria bacterium]